MPRKSAKSKNTTFENALDELEGITRNLEGGGLTLDESIQAYEKGMELRKICQEMLGEAEKKLEYLEKKENGELVRESVAEPDEASQDNLF